MNRPRGALITQILVRVGVVLVVLGVIAVVLVLALGGSSSKSAPRTVESIFQDDQFLLYSPTPTVEKTLRTLRALGVDRIRVTILWSAIAPDSLSRVRPRHFDATDPAAYPAAAWTNYDRVAVLARASGIAVDFNLTAPGPLWAMARRAPSAKFVNHYRPSATAFGQFVTAMGRRYSGTYAAATGAYAGHNPLPRVSFWTIWNEPNQAGWLAPQWRATAGTTVADSPRLYRQYVDAAFSALERTGHAPSSDTVLIGELAPEGVSTQRPQDPMRPMVFLRALYCVDGSFRPLRGAPAAALHCPQTGSPSAFASAHPGLFQASGFAHHPYFFFLAPSVHFPRDPNFVPLADLSRLENGLDRSLQAYGVHRQLPIWVTEYGYETNPPNPFRGVSLQRQARYLDQAQYMAWKDPRISSFAQFLLVDSAPDRNYPPGTLGYWSTFQTGLLFLNGKAKPSLYTYPLPIFIPDPVASAGSSVMVWGMLRLAPNNTTQRALIQWRGSSGGFRTLTTVTTKDPNGFVTANVKLPGTGSVRIAWISPTRVPYWSRSVAVRSS